MLVGTVVDILGHRGGHAALTKGTRVTVRLSRNWLRRSWCGRWSRSARRTGRPVARESSAAEAVPDCWLALVVAACEKPLCASVATAFVTSEMARLWVVSLARSSVSSMTSVSPAGCAATSRRPLSGAFPGASAAECSSWPRVTPWAYQDWLKVSSAPKATVLNPRVACGQGGQVKRGELGRGHVDELGVLRAADGVHQKSRVLHTLGGVFTGTR